MTDARSQLEQVRARLQQALAPNVVDDWEQFTRLVIQDEIDNDRARNGHTAKLWYTTKEAAERLGCTDKAIRERNRRGRYGEPRRDGRRLYLSAKAVDADASGE